MNIFVELSRKLKQEEYENSHLEFYLYDDEEKPFL